ncbi:hypothetical protein QTN25_003105 [Entamoeba marina]
MQSDNPHFSRKTDVPFLSKYPSESPELCQSDKLNLSFSSSESTTPRYSFNFQQYQYSDDYMDSEGSSAVTPCTYSADNEIQSILNQQLTSSGSTESSLQRSKHPALQIP